MKIENLSDYLIKQIENEKIRLIEIASYNPSSKKSRTIVKNVPNSSEYKEPNGSSCIGYWEKATGIELKDDIIYSCPACGNSMSKKDSNLDGAHVYKPSDERKWFFVPLCSACNNPDNTDEMEVNVKLVPVPSECYEKKPTK